SRERIQLLLHLGRRILHHCLPREATGVRDADNAAAVPDYFRPEALGHQFVKKCFADPLGVTKFFNSIGRFVSTWIKLAGGVDRTLLGCRDFIYAIARP